MSKIGIIDFQQSTLESFHPILQGGVFGLAALRLREIEIALGEGDQGFGERGVKDFSSVR